jgi:hypothetical protein
VSSLHILKLKFCTFFSSPSCNLYRPPWFDHLNNISYRIQVMKLSCNHFHINFSISLLGYFSNTLNLCSVFRVRDEVYLTNPYKVLSKIIFSTHPILLHLFLIAMLLCRARVVQTRNWQLGLNFQQKRLFSLSRYGDWLYALPIYLSNRYQETFSQHLVSWRRLMNAILKRTNLIHKLSERE